MSAHTKKAFLAPHRRCGHVEGGVSVILLVQFFVLSLMVLILAFSLVVQIFALSLTVLILVLSLMM